MEVSNPDRILFPDDEVTKLDLIHYYRDIAPTMLPHLKDRPISMQRFPNGIDEEGFYQKEVPDYFPNWVDRATVAVRGEGGEQEQVVCNKAATLAYLANQACITPHVWLSRRKSLDRPDRLIFDLDPEDESGFATVREAADILRTTLSDYGLASYLMLTGSRGLHLVTPLRPKKEFALVRDFARKVASQVAQAKSDRLTTETRKAKRKGRLFIDYLRNAYAQTAAPPYAIRPRQGAPVATPIDWEELRRNDLHSRSFTIKNIFRRLGQKEDPWTDIQNDARDLPDLDE